MPKDQRKRQQIRQRDAARRREKTHRAGAATPMGPRAMLRAAAHWPLYECQVSLDWDREGALAQICVARRSTLDAVAAAVFLVDPGCLGMKDAYARLFESPLEYRDLVEGLSALQPMQPADLDLAAKIIRDSIAYARSLGFQPHPDYAQAAPLLEGAEPDRCETPVPVGGRDGKPNFISGPHDDVPHILAQLERVVGPGNFHYTLRADQVAPEDIDDLDEDAAEEDSAEDETEMEERPSLLRRLGLPFGP